MKGSVEIFWLTIIAIGVLMVFGSLSIIIRGWYRDRQERKFREEQDGKE